MGSGANQSRARSPLFFSLRCLLFSRFSLPTPRSQANSPFLPPLPFPSPLILSLFPQVALKSTQPLSPFLLFSPPPPLLPTYLPPSLPLSLSLLSSASRASLRVLASASFARGGIPQVNNPCPVSPSACWISFALRVIRGVSNRPYAQKPRELSRQSVDSHSCEEMRRMDSVPSSVIRAGTSRVIPDCLRIRRCHRWSPSASLISSLALVSL